MTATNVGQQGVDANAIAQQVQADVQREVQQAIDAANAAAREAAAARADAQGSPTAIVRGPDGSLVIRDGRNGEAVVVGPDALPGWLHEGPTTQMVAVPIALFAAIAFTIVGWPIARAFARRMDRGGASGASGAAVAPGAELRQLQTSIDTMAVEIERMSEHQRYLTRVLAERTGETFAAPRDGARLSQP